MNFDIYDKIIPFNSTTSIQIFASAGCAKAYVQGNSDCIEHGRRLKRYFLQTRTPKYGTYVRYDVVGSSAASYARMIDARILICPPGTVMCLLPALGKKPGKKAYIAEDPSREATFHWFENHVLEERKRLGFQEMEFDAVAESDFIDIISDVDLTIPVGVVGLPTTTTVTDADLDPITGESNVNDELVANARVDIDADEEIDVVDIE